MQHESLHLNLKNYLLLKMRKKILSSIVHLTHQLLYVGTRILSYKNFVGATDIGSARNIQSSQVVVCGTQDTLGGSSDILFIRIPAS